MWEAEFDDKKRLKENTMYVGIIIGARGQIEVYTVGVNSHAVAVEKIIRKAEANGMIVTRHFIRRAITGGARKVWPSKT